MFLQNYNLVWNHTPSSRMGSADTLSFKDFIDTSQNNSFQVLLSDLQINLLDAILVSKIIESTPSDQFVIHVLVALNAETVPLPHSTKDDWYFDHEALYYKAKLFIPKAAQHS